MVLLAPICQGPFVAEDREEEAWADKVRGIYTAMFWNGCIQKSGLGMGLHKAVAKLMPAPIALWESTGVHSRDSGCKGV